MALKSVMVVSPDEQVREQVARTLSALGKTLEFIKERSFKGLLATPIRKPAALVVDTSTGSLAELTNFLQRFRSKQDGRSMHVVFLRRETKEEILAIAGEYNIFKMISGEHYADSLVSIFQEISSELARPSGQRTQQQRLDAAVDQGAPGEIDRITEDFYRLYPDNPRACVEFANLCVRRGDWDKAKEVATRLQAQSQGQQNLRMINVLARIHMHKGEFEQAVQLMNRAEILSPQNLERLICLGDSYRELGDNKNAKESYEKALALEPGDVAARKGMGQVLLTDGQMNDALEMFRDAASEDEVGGFFNNTAIFAARRQDYDKAMNLYLKAAEVLQGPRLRAKVLFNMGFAFERWQKPQQATRCFIEALRADPGFDKARKRLKNLGVEPSPESLAVNSSPASSASPAQGDSDLRKALLAVDPKEAAHPATDSGAIEVKPSKDRSVTPFSVKVLEEERSEKAPKQPASAKSEPAAKFLDEEEDF